MEPETTPPPEASEAQPPAERYPFWGYGDLLLFSGMAVPSMMAGAALVSAVVAALGLHIGNRVFVLLAAQFLGYLILFVLLWLLFRFQHGRPLWRSLGWVHSRVPAIRLVMAGVGLALAVAIASVVLQTPDLDNPMKALLADPKAVLLVAIFGTTLGPLAEELVFRGFMQPLFVKSLGAVPGILLAAVPFGLLHLQQYGWSWRHGLLITLAGAGFGWMRHRTGSTRAATAMHMAYNCMFFLALVAQKREFPQTW
ncbi:MAG TPA: type II CAAX endopeptidase family protein [Bryobacteraceae bacterium]|nr:type II CAAX endopeptidase family protein [Bryobacteraceae bacterium]